MCGIYGYMGPKNAIKVCLDGLKLLEYRGYDSSGIAGIKDGKLLFRKEVGKIQALENSIKTDPFHVDLAIAHTRWATHGVPSRLNAHPHLDSNETLAIIHNGIIENYNEIRSKLESKGIAFKTETDTEVLAELIAQKYSGDIVEAVRLATAEIKGFWGIAVIHKNHPDTIVACAKENPVAIGLTPDKQEVYISSDPNAFTASDLDVMYLKNDEIALITPKGIEVYDTALARVEKALERLGIDSQSISKNGYEHFMLKEIFEQPLTLAQAMNERLNFEFGLPDFENFKMSAKELLGVKHILILGCGTSWHAGSLAALLLEDIARIPTNCEIASEYRYKNPIVSDGTLVIAISQSGETLDTLAAVREVKAKGAKVIGICNVRNSTLSREADETIFLKAGPEISVCSTKAFTSQLTVLLLFTLLMGRLRNITKEQGQAFLSEIKDLPRKVEQVLLQKDVIQSFAKKYAHFNQFFFLGRNYMYITGLEAALKLKEISYLNAIGYPSGELKHGPIALLCPEFPVIGLCGNKRTYEKMLSNLMEVKSRGAPILAIASGDCPGLEGVTKDILYLPESSDHFAAIPYSIAMQLFAYYIAVERGTEIDQPRNLAKSVTVE